MSDKKYPFGIVAVSYTHLDVYKRQRQRAAVAHVPGQTQHLAGGVALVGRSQHHREGSGLPSAAQDQGDGDVYKRKPLVSSYEKLSM